MNSQKVVDDILWRCEASPGCQKLVPNDDTVVNEFYYWIGNDQSTTDAQKEVQYNAVDTGMLSPSSRANLYY